MILAELSILGEREPIICPLSGSPRRFALCPGLECDATGEWYYVRRWWLLCHLWTNEVGESEARPLILVEQELPLCQWTVDMSKPVGRTSTAAVAIEE